MSEISLKSRFEGCLLGLAVGDAVGTTLEFKLPGSFEPIKDMVGGGPFLLSSGQWTDDTSMALCLGESLLKCNGFDPADQMRRYCDWWRKGHLSSTGKCFDIGNTVAAALASFEKSGEPYSGSSDPFAAGNGSLMRLAPVALYFYPNLEKMTDYAAKSSRTTHAAKESIEACQYFASLIYRVFSGEPREQLSTKTLFEPTTIKLRYVSSGGFLAKGAQVIRGSGYVVESLEAALWCFYHTDSFESAVLAAANLGDDADTTAAICGQIAGAFYGVEGIPKRWLDKLSMGDFIQQMANDLLSAGTKGKAF